MLVPVLTTGLLRGHQVGAERGRVVVRARERLTALLGRASRWPVLVLLVYLAAAAGVLFVVGPHLGVEIFPRVDVGEFQLRLRAPSGTRIERTEQITLQAMKLIAEQVG